MGGVIHEKQLLHKDLSNRGVTVEEAERKIIWTLPLKLGTTKGIVLLFLNKARALFSLFLYFCFSVKTLVSGTHELSDGNWPVVWEMAGAGLTAANKGFVTIARHRSYRVLGSSCNHVIMFLNKASDRFTCLVSSIVSFPLTNSISSELTVNM